MISQIADLADLVYGDSGDPFDSREAFLDRLEGYRAAKDFTLLAVQDEQATVTAFLFGYGLQPQQVGDHPATARWWRSVRPPLSDDFLTETTAGRTFAICEIVTHPDWQGRGIATALQEKIAQIYPDRRLTLLVELDNTVAHRLYSSWGFESVGLQCPVPGAPDMDTLVRPAASPVPASWSAANGHAFTSSATSRLAREATQEPGRRTR